MGAARRVFRNLVPAVAIALVGTSLAVRMQKRRTHAPAARRTAAETAKPARAVKAAGGTERAGAEDLLDPSARTWDLNEERARIDAFKARALPAGPRAPDEPANALEPEDAATVAAIEKAYDADDLEGALALAEKARASKEPAVRSAMVWTLDWFGEKALPEIVSFMSDPDEDVAEEAFRAWESAMDEIEDETRKIDIIEHVMKSAAPADVLESASLEYVGLDDRATVESLVRVISSGGDGARVAKERYEAVTGDEYTTPEDAEKWIENFASGGDPE